MTEKQERRAPGVNRVTVARIVDICGRDATVPAFEAESVELSGRGMHVRTPYLPPPGAPLVCRLDDGGREIVVEGVVAWQREHEGGGEFGVQFTALDSGSVEALKDLCGLDEAEEKAEPAVEQAAPVPAAPAGAPVKLHIEGLGAPMKARVRDGGARRLKVGSNLEFLKVGRGLEVEDVEQGDRRGARIDAVSIAIDPKTQVPQLVVVLRYDGQDATPEPSVVDDDGSPPALAVGIDPSPVPATATSATSLTDIVESTDVADEDDAARSLRGPVDAAAATVGKAMQRAGGRFAELGGEAAVSFARWAKAKGAELGELARRRKSERRTTAKAPQSVAPPTSRRLRPQNSERPGDAAPGTKRRKVAMAAGASALVLGVVAFAFSRGSEAPAADQAKVAVEPAPAAAPPPAPAAPAPATPGTGNPAVVANVPLFGPTPMATLEPAPLGPSPEELARAAKAGAGVEERMDDDEASEKEAAADETFDDRSAKKDEAKTEVKPEEVKPFLQGKLHLPVVHRIQLDKPGAALKGTKEASGFSVVVPGRKVSESGLGISKRDDRIASVKTANTPGGAKITFVFRSKVPGFKVRLKRNYVEFFISSPGGAL